jgi:hypothetical protein
MGTSDEITKVSLFLTSDDRRLATRVGLFVEGGIAQV